MGIVQIALPYALFAWALQRVPGPEASLLTLIEPVLNPVWVALFVGERPGPATLLGGGLILVALLLRSVIWSRA
jgi:drug/metabolite transporter, DME family